MFYCLLSFESIFRGDFNWSCGMKYKYLCKTVSLLTHLFCYSLIWGYYIFYHYMKSVQIRSLFRSGFSCIQENTDQKKFRIWTLSTQCTSAWLSWLTFQLRGTTNEFCNEFTNEALLLADSYYKFLRCYKTLKKFFSKNSFLGLIYFLRLVL